MLRKLLGGREPIPGRPDTTGTEERGMPTHEGTVELRQGREALGVGDHEKCSEPITKSAELTQIIVGPFSLSS